MELPAGKMTHAKYPSLYQINTRVWLTDLSKGLGRRATLDDVPDAELDKLASLGFHWIWFLSVWTTGELGRKVSLEHSEWRREFQETLPDLKEEDIGGSGFAIADYHVHPGLGGDDALRRLRDRLHKRGLKLMLDFVPNHMAPDHPWLLDHPDYFLKGTEEDLTRNPLNYTRIKLKKGEVIFALGRDPYFPAWPDTVQLDYSKPATAEAMKQELLRIACQCDGLRCDMAMLILPETFERTWGRKAKPFWGGAIQAVRKSDPDFLFMAEVYWDLEWTLQQLGFDYAYDKRLYDRLRDGDARPVREHFYAGLDYQDKLARFLENHDEQRAAAAFAPDQHEAAAVITFLSPGMRFFHQGQIEWKLKRISPHLVRGPIETVHTDLVKFYVDLLAIVRKPIHRDGTWQLLECAPAWEGNWTWDAFIAMRWLGNRGDRTVIVINYSMHHAQCYLRLPFSDLMGVSWRFQDLMSDALYDRDGSGLVTHGLFLDMRPWQYHVFEMKKLK